MLWYKAWLETRVRFLICLIFITWFCALRTSNLQGDAYIHIAFWWLVAVTPLTMGGLLREKAVGAATFTMALPFSRMRLVAVRIAMSLIQALALIVVPWVAVFAIGSRTSFSRPQALFHFALLTGGGIVLYAIAFLVSCVVEGEYTAPLVSGGIVMMFVFANNGPRLHSYSPVLFMLGNDHYDAHSGLLSGAVPWAQIAVYTLAAALLLGLSIKAIQAREF